MYKLFFNTKTLAVTAEIPQGKLEYHISYYRMC